LFYNAANHLAPKAFNPSIASAFSVDIAIAEADLVKHIVGNSRIVEAGSGVEEVVRIGHHRRLSSLDSQVSDDSQHLPQHSEADSLSTIEQNDSQASLAMS
jgi:hypothetical protein